MALPIPSSGCACWCARISARFSKASAPRRCCLLGETRALDAAAHAEIAAAFDRYQVPWQETLDELAQAGRIASATPPVRLLLFGMLNWSKHWYRADGKLSLDELADSALALLLGAPPGNRGER